jgi:hypothetical protein
LFRGSNFLNHERRKEENKEKYLNSLNHKTHESRKNSRNKSKRSLAIAFPNLTLN